MLLDQYNFSQITGGHERIVARLYDDTTSRIKQNDLIFFTVLPDRNKRLVVIAQDLKQFPNFKELFAHYTAQEVGGAPGESAEELATNMARYYTPEQINENGVIAIRVNPVASL
ncbi:hypothetical protein IV38_GL000353 [Lactobacillus selangorensis]|uniref:ASCH domain-containing protein n=2 Tax=Lactobacillus selangorensis TaxID=81857 RepID=A0A0R2FWY0_9LACO|nr:hypothetical protein IV38_GL000353 [Lactobacillus selangorensis]KRN34002.1 hypothetical protein IV40_GL000315 [Lactobacillus selangorensis]